MDADLAVDDEFHPRQADAFVGQAGKRKRQFGVAHVHHDFGRGFGHIVQRQINHVHFKQAFVNQARIALGTRHGNFLAVLQYFGGVAAAHHRRNAQLARNDGGMASAPAAVGHNSSGAFHHRLPIGIGHVGHQNIARLHHIHFGSVFNQAHFALAYFLADGAAFGQHGGFLLNAVAA